MLVVPEPGQHEPFWDEEAASLIAGLVLYVAFMAAPEERHLGAVRHLLTLGEHALFDCTQSPHRTRDLATLT